MDRRNKDGPSSRRHRRQGRQTAEEVFSPLSSSNNHNRSRSTHRSQKKHSNSNSIASKRKYKQQELEQQQQPMDHYSAGKRLRRRSSSERRQKQKRRSSSTHQPKQKKNSRTQSVYNIDDSSDDADADDESELRVPRKRKQPTSDDDVVHCDDDDDDDEEELETPYFQSLHFPGSSQMLMRPSHHSTNQKKEPIRAGDVIEYTNPLFVSGSKQGHRISQVVAVRAQGDFVLELDNGELVPGDTRIKRVRECLDNNKLYTHAGIFRTLDQFRLVPGKLKGSERTGMARQIERVKQILDEGRKQQDEIFRKVYQGDQGSGTDTDKDDNSEDESNHSNHGSDSEIDGALESSENAGTENPASKSTEGPAKQAETKLTTSQILANSDTDSDLDELLRTAPRIGNHTVGHTSSTLSTLHPPADATATATIDSGDGMVDPPQKEDSGGGGGGESCLQSSDEADAVEKPTTGRSRSTHPTDHSDHLSVSSTEPTPKPAVARVTKDNLQCDSDSDESKPKPQAVGRKEDDDPSMDSKKKGPPTRLENTTSSGPVPVPSFTLGKFRQRKKAAKPQKARNQQQQQDYYTAVGVAEKKGSTAKSSKEGQATQDSIDLTNSNSDCNASLPKDDDKSEDETRQEENSGTILGEPKESPSNESVFDFPDNSQEDDPAAKVASASRFNLRSPIYVRDATKPNERYSSGKKIRRRTPPSNSKAEKAASKETKTSPNYYCSLDKSPRRSPRFSTHGSSPSADPVAEGSAHGEGSTISESSHSQEHQFDENHSQSDADPSEEEQQQKTIDMVSSVGTANSSGTETSDSEKERRNRSSELCIVSSAAKRRMDRTEARQNKSKSAHRKRGASWMQAGQNRRFDSSSSDDDSDDEDGRKETQGRRAASPLLSGSDNGAARRSSAGQKRPPAAIAIRHRRRGPSSSEEESDDEVARRLVAKNLPYKPERSPMTYRGYRGSASSSPAAKGSGKAGHKREQNSKTNRFTLTKQNHASVAGRSPRRDQNAKQRSNFESSRAPVRASGKGVLPPTKQDRTADDSRRKGGTAASVSKPSASDGNRDYRRSGSNSLGRASSSSKYDWGSWQGDNNNGMTLSQLSHLPEQYSSSQNSQPKKHAGSNGSLRQSHEKTPLHSLMGKSKELSLSIEDSESSSDEIPGPIQSSRRRSRENDERAETKSERNSEAKKGRRKSTSLTNYNSGRLSFTKVSKGCHI